MVGVDVSLEIIKRRDARSSRVGRGCCHQNQLNGVGVHVRLTHFMQSVRVLEFG